MEQKGRRISNGTALGKSPRQRQDERAEYQALKNAGIARVQLQNGSYAEIIAGEYQGVHGSASTFSPVNLFNVHLKKNSEATFSFPAGHTTAILLIEGSVTVNGSDNVPQDHFALFANKGETFSLTSAGDAIVLVLSGEPLNEPIVSYGPFVMNTEKEIEEAIRDFNMGKFGYLED